MYSFFIFVVSNDTIYIAYALPYTYSDLKLYFPTLIIEICQVSANLSFKYPHYALPWPITIATLYK